MRQTHIIRSGRLATAVGAFALACTARAGEVSFTQSFTNGTQSASATFVFNDDGPTTTLSIMLTNTMTANGNPSWLCGLFFDLAGSPTMSYTGLGGDGSDAFNDMVVIQNGSGSNPDSSSPYNTVIVDHFWGLDQNIGDGLLPFGSQQYGLGAAGFGVFASTTVLNLQAGGPLPQLDGSDGGILSGGMLDAGTLNIPNGHTGRPMVDGGIWLTFDLGEYDLDGAAVSDVVFVYGTSFGEVVLIPVPAALPLGIAGLAGLLIGRKRLVRRLSS
jgi:hypothetical protein